MKRMKFISCVSCIAVMLFYSCSEEKLFPQDVPDDVIDKEEVVVPTVPDDPGDSEDEALNPNSQTVFYENAVTLVFFDGSVAVDNPFESGGVTIEEEGGHAIIRSSITGTVINYVLSGITDNGSVKIYGENDFGLVFNGVGITNPSGAAVNIQNKEKCTVTLVDQTNNRLIDGEEYLYTDGEDMKATWFSEGDLLFSGAGSLEIRGKNKHGLCTDGALSISSGTIYIKEAVGDGIHVNNEIDLSGGLLTIRSVGDGIESESKKAPVTITGGEINITTTGEKGHAVKTKHNILINTNGTIDITIYGDASKGLKPTGDLTILRGDIIINTAGDAIWEEDEQDTSSAAGVKCDGNFLMENGNLTIVSAGKGGKGINADGALTINDGTVSVTTTGNQYVYDRNNDTAAKAVKSDGDLTINGGTVRILTTKTEAEGLESKATLTIAGGDVEIRAYDDCINAANHIQIDGGTIYCNSTTNDAIDSNGTLSITGGLVIAAGAGAPEGGIDCDNNRFVITGGTLIGLGASTSSPTANYCTQRSLVFGSSGSTISVIRIEATLGGDEVLTFRLPKAYSQLSMLFSSPLLNASTSYTIYTGGTITGDDHYYGLYTGASYTRGSSAATFTTGSAAGSVSTAGSTGGGMGGGPGGGWH